MKKIVEQNIIRFIDRHNLIKNGDKLLIAFSGGADSLFALHFFNKYKTKYGITLSAFHLNHLLRGTESDEDEKFCRAFCEKEEIEFHSENFDVKKYAAKNKLSLEEAARIIRYNLLENFAEANGFSKIVTAHNSDDNTETVLLNLFRGTGLNGASGIPVKRGMVIRPFLSVAKKEIVDYLTGNNILFRTDSSNLQNDFNRNFLRNEIIPKIRKKINPSLDLNILKFSETAADSYKIISGLTDKIIKQGIEPTENGIKILNLINSNFEDETTKMAIKLSTEKYLNIILSFDNILQIKNLFAHNTGSRLDLSDNLSAIREREFIYLYRKDLQNEQKKEWTLNLNEEINIEGKKISARIVPKATINNSGNIEFIDGDRISFPLKIRRWKAGDKFTPLGLKGTKKISDFLTDIKVDAANKKNQFVVLSNKKIIWVINGRIDESVKTDKNSKRIIKLWVK